MKRRLTRTGVQLFPVTMCPSECTARWSRTAFSVAVAFLAVTAVLTTTQAAPVDSTLELECNGLWGRSVSSRGYYGDSALHTAARDGRAACARALLRAGGDPDVSNNLRYTPLHYAAGKGRPEMVKLLLRAGANPEAQDFLSGRPLHKAAYSGCLECTDALLQRGADVDPRDHLERTPLWWAAVQGNAEVVWRLVAAGADVEAEDRRDHRRPLHGAAKVGCAECVRVLLAAGADRYTKNSYGQTPRELARNPHVAYLL